MPRNTEQDCENCDGEGAVCDTCDEAVDYCDCDESQFVNCPMCAGTGYRS